MAVRIARLLGAGRVVGAGRDPDRLRAVADAGADDTVRLTADSDGTGRALAAAAAEVDIVIDYLWGTPAQQAMMALLTARSDRSGRWTGSRSASLAGPAIELPSAALRAADVRLQGSGQGWGLPRFLPGRASPPSSTRSTPERFRPRRSRCRWPRWRAPGPARTRRGSAPSSFREPQPDRGAACDFR